jgi:hypothetical protein
MNPGLTKNYSAGADIAARLIVKPGASDGLVVAAAGATDGILGVTTDIDVKSGEPCDVIHAGIALVKTGAAFAFGDPITSDGNGKAIKAAPAATATDRILGYALGTSGAADELVDVLIQLGGLSNAANA